MSDNISWGYALSCFDHANDNPERSLAEKVDLIAGTGCSGYQCDVPLAWPVEELAAEAERVGLQCLSVNDWQQQMERFDEHLAVAERLGARYLNHHLPQGLDGPAAAAMTRDLAQRCADRGVRYLVELHRSTYTHRLDDVYELMARNPEVEFLGDFSHYVILSEPESRFAPTYPRLRALHLRVANPNAVQMDIAEGQTDGLDAYRQVFQRALRTGAVDTVISEMIPYYMQVPRYDLHAANARLLTLARSWAADLSDDD